MLIPVPMMQLHATAVYLTFRQRSAYLAVIPIDVVGPFDGESAAVGPTRNGASEHEVVVFEHRPAPYALHLCGKHIPHCQCHRLKQDILAVCRHAHGMHLHGEGEVLALLALPRVGPVAAPCRLLAAYGYGHQFTFLSVVVMQEVVGGIRLFNLYYLYLFQFSFSRLFLIITFIIGWRESSLTYRISDLGCRIQTNVYRK